MKIAIITVAGISSRFNENIPDDKKVLKCLFHKSNPQETLIFKILDKLNFADKIVIVGGYRFSDLTEYINTQIPKEIKDKISLVYNNHFSDLNSGYSLYLGVKKSLYNFNEVSEIVFVEGDLDIDRESFFKVVDSDKNVLTFNYEPIYSNKSVVLYQNENSEYYYLFNSNHETLTINESFKAIFNSGQIWKFNNMELLKIANDNFKENLIEDTNLSIIQKYINLLNKDDIELIGLKHWVNCNTREDYEIIKKYWEETE